MESPRIRTVVVGYGLAGKSFHCYLVKHAEGLQLYGVVSRDPGTRKQIIEDQRENVVTFQSII